MTTIQEDLGIALGGQLNVAAMGRDAVEALQAKILQQPDAYLKALRETVLGDAFDPKMHADLHIAPLLLLLHPVRPDEVRAITATLLRLYDGVLIPFDGAKDRSLLDTVMDEESVNLMYRLNTRRLELRALTDRLARGPSR